MVDKSLPIPIYVQIEEELKKRMQQGEYKVGEAIPSERELTEYFGVSRMTVRQAVNNLVAGGLLRREKGRGTFVASPKLEQRLNQLTSFTQDMLAMGLTPSNQILIFERKVPPANIAQQLGLRVDEEVYYVERIRNADEQPMAIERSFIPLSISPNLQEEQLKGSWYRMLQEDYDYQLGRAVQQMEAAIPTKEDSELLQLDSKGVVLKLQRTSYLLDGRPFELVQSVYRADRYKFTVEF